MAGGIVKDGTRPELKALVAEASLALAQLDAAHLEELALSCQALNRGLKGGSGGNEAAEPSPLSDADRLQLAQEAREAVGEMAIFARVLEVTRANLRVMRRLRELRMDQLNRLEYSERPLVGAGWDAAEGGSGNGNGND